MSTPIYIGASDAAKELGVNTSTIHRMAARLGVGREIVGRLALTPDEIETLRANVRGKGSPKFAPGNDLWRIREERKKSRKKLP